MNKELIEGHWNFFDLFAEAQKNRDACNDFVRRLEQRFSHYVVIKSNGKPGHIRGFHNGPYWTILNPYPNAKKVLPANVVMEWRALTAQGLRIRQQLLALQPEISLNLVFPLYGRGSNV